MEGEREREGSMEGEGGIVKEKEGERGRDSLNQKPPTRSTGWVARIRLMPPRRLG